MLRNKEIRVFLVTIVIIAIIGTICASYISLQASVATAVTSLLLITSFMLYTAWRYREIGKLSDYLRKISNGDYSLDVRDNHEGELSILKSDMYKVTLRLSENSSRLQEDKLKLTDAISDISHQLKTPLTSMMVMSDLLRDPGLEEGKRREFTRRIQVQLERIEWLVSSLLKLSKIDAGTARFKKENVDVSALIRDAVDPLLIPMEIKDVTLQIEDGSASFVGDGNWTKEAIINILKNSIEHSSEGGRITIAYQENALFTEITITDQGSGIPMEDLPHIFKRFYRGKNATEDSVGIGLAMAYSIMKNQDGDIEVSTSPAGTTFSLKVYKHTI